jgi:hypothetical protein
MLLKLRILGHVTAQGVSNYNNKTLSEFFVDSKCSFKRCIVLWHSIGDTSHCTNRM